MIHGKKRNGNLFKRLTESWGYVKEESEETPLDEQMVQEEGEKKPDADGDGVPDWADKKDGDDELDEGGMYKRNAPPTEREDDEDELEEGGTADRPESKEKGAERVAAADRGRRVNEAGDGTDVSLKSGDEGDEGEEVVEEEATGGSGSSTAGASVSAEEDETNMGGDSSLEETIRRVVTRVLNDITTK